MMLGLVVGHCYLCWGRDRRITHAVQIHAGLMFVCVSATEFECSSVWEVCTTP